MKQRTDFDNVNGHTIFYTKLYKTVFTQIRSSFVNEFQR